MSLSISGKRSTDRMRLLIYVLSVSTECAQSGIEITCFSAFCLLLGYCLFHSNSIILELDTFKVQETSKEHDIFASSSY